MTKEKTTRKKKTWGKKKRVSRRDFLTRSAAAASAAALGSGEVPSANAQDSGDSPQSEFSLRTRALVTVLTRKNLVRPDTMDAVVDFYENRVGPHIGARVVARSWIDPEYRERLLTDARGVARDDGISGFQGTDLVAVENTPSVHNLVVCTLCSCYPWSLLGLPPAWYRDTSYRARAVIEPRRVLEEFGVELSNETEVRVWDSTAEIRYLVIPERPPGTEGLTLDELAALVTRDSMVGVELLKSPGEAD